MDHPNIELDILSLPPEVMVKIFEFLTLRERKAASLTCKTWYQLAFSPTLCRKMFADFWFGIGEIRDYEKYRRAHVTTDAYDQNQCGMAEFFQTAPLETLEIFGRNIDSINTLLDNHLLAMKKLTTLVVRVHRSEVFSEGVIEINHPNLKSVKVCDSAGYATFEINCPNLIDLSITDAYTQNTSDRMKVVQHVQQMQRQLQSLAVSVYEPGQLEKLANTNLSNLKKLEMFLGTPMIDSTMVIELFFNCISNLVEMKLQGNNFHIVRIGEELGVLNKLSKLTLLNLSIKMVGFENALRNMEQLNDLELLLCKFGPPTDQWQNALKHVKNLRISETNGFLTMLPRCTKLKSLRFTAFISTLDDIFVQVCNSYPQLEKLHLELPKNNKFHSWKSFPRIKQLNQLKELHLDRVDLVDVDWTECSSLRIEKLWFEQCQIRGNQFQQLVQSVGPGLQQLFLSNCNATLDVFLIDPEFVEALRKVLPWCRISSDCYRSSFWKRDDSVQLGNVCVTRRTK